MLDALYARYNDRAYHKTDPVSFVHRYPGAADKELAGLVSASLSYGNVVMILRSVERILSPLGSKPSVALRSLDDRELMQMYRDFRHRWTRGHHVVMLLAGCRDMMERYGSLGDGFRSCRERGDPDLIPSLDRWVREMKRHQLGAAGDLLSEPSGGSACKRLFMYLRWMVRRDQVDAGLWRSVKPSELLVPVDVHMHRVARKLGFTRRKQANLATSRDITAALAVLDPEDPVKYDFALTRGGILGEDPESVYGISASTR